MFAQTISRSVTTNPVSTARAPTTGRDTNDGRRAWFASPIVDDTETLHVAALFLDRLHTPQTGERRAARLLRRHAPADVLLDVQFQVRLQLCVELALDALATEQIHQANGGLP